MSIFASSESPFQLTQDYRPGLPSVAPLRGWCLVALPLFVYPVFSIDWSLCVEQLEMMVLDVLLRTCASNRFGLASLGPRTSRLGLHVLRDCVRSFALLTGLGRPSSI